MTTKSLVFSWALLSLCTLQCMALSDSQRAGHSKREELQNLGSLLAESLRGSDRPKKEASAPVKEFFDEYFAAKEREQGTSMWNLLPINCTRRDLYADTIEVLESTTPGEIVLNNRVTALHQFSFDDMETVNAKIVAAELRLEAPDSPRGMLFAYQLLEPAKANYNTAKKLLHVRRLGESPNASTMILNVTSLAKEWLLSSRLNHGIEIDFQYEASVPQVLPASPLLVLYMSSNENYQYTMEETRQRRHVPSKRQSDLSPIDVQAIYATEQPPATEAPSGTLPCHVDDVVLTTEEMGLSDVILTPTRIRFTFCNGHCHWPFPQNVSATNAGRIQGRVAVLSGKVPQPCCAPKEYGSQKYLFRKGPKSIRADILPNSKVLSCECK